MLRILTIAAGLLVGAVSLAWAEPQIGAPAPAFSGADSNGKTIALKDFKGAVVVLEWTNNKCPYVSKYYGSGAMQALQKDATAQNVVWISIISSAPGEQGHLNGQQADALTHSRGAKPAHVVLDPGGSIGRAYDAKTTPHMFVIDKTGSLVYRGAIDDKPTTRTADIPGATNYVRLALSELGQGKPLSTPETVPYGCSVKY